MTTSDRYGSSQKPPAGNTVDLERGLSLDSYVAHSSQKLEAITNRIHQDETLDSASRDWMLDQVNFIVDAIGDESLQLGEQLRSDLLQLLMAIANLNEEIRCLAATTHPPN